MIQRALYYIRLHEYFVQGCSHGKSPHPAVFLCHANAAIMLQTSAYPARCDDLLIVISVDNLLLISMLWFVNQRECPPAVSNSSAGCFSAHFLSSTSPKIGQESNLLHLLLCQKHNPPGTSAGEMTAHHFLLLLLHLSGNKCGWAEPRMGQWHRQDNRAMILSRSVVDI